MRAEKRKSIVHSKLITGCEEFDCHTAAVSIFSYTRSVSCQVRHVEVCRPSLASTFLPP